MSFRDDFKEAANLAKDFFQEDRKQREKEQHTIMLKCPYCGGENRVVWQEGALPRCPNCGGEYNAADIEAWKEEQRKKIAALNVPHETPSESVGSFLKRGKKYLVIAAGAIVLLIGCGIAAALNGGHFDARFEINGSTAPAASSGEEPADTSSMIFWMIFLMIFLMISLTTTSRICISRNLKENVPGVKRTAGGMTNRPNAISGTIPTASPLTGPTGLPASAAIMGITAGCTTIRTWTNGTYRRTKTNGKASRMNTTRRISGTSVKIIRNCWKSLSEAG